MTAKIKARVWLDGRPEPVIADVMNPGGWFGSAHILQFAIANALNPFLVVEADHEQEAIDWLADDEKWGHLINDEEGQEEYDAWWENHDASKPAYGDDASCSEHPPEFTTAGNDSHVVNLDNVAFCKFDKIEYFVDLDIDNWGEVSAIASAIKEESED